MVSDGIRLPDCTKICSDSLDITTLPEPWLFSIYHYVADIWLSICIYVMRMGQTHHLTYPYSSCIKLTTHLNYI
jgi:hypothetical protein